MMATGDMVVSPVAGKDGLGCAMKVDAMQMPHPVFGELVTSNRLIRGGRWVFRGTVVLLDDVFAELASGSSLHDVWERHGSLDRRDLEAIVDRAFGRHVEALRKPSGRIDTGADRQGLATRIERRAA